MEDKVTLWRGLRQLQMWEMDTTLDNVARIFKLTPMSIFLIDDTGLVLVPSSIGSFGDIQCGGRYEICGEEATASQQQPVNPRNVFQFGASPVASAGCAGHTAPAHVGRSFSRTISVGSVDGGTLRADGGTLYVNFMEHEANLKNISEKIKNYLSTEEEVILCDSQGNRLLDGPGTTGLGFWRQNARRIISRRDSSFRELRRTGRIDDATVERVEELVLAAEELPAIKQTLKELGQYARANKINTVALTDHQVTTVRDTFQCLICRDVMDNPVVTQCCRSFIGCRVCVNEWTAFNKHCPKCRDEAFEEKHFAITGMGEVIDVLRDTIRS